MCQYFWTLLSNSLQQNFACTLRYISRDIISLFGSKFHSLSLKKKALPCTLDRTQQKNICDISVHKYMIILKKEIFYINVQHPAHLKI